MILGPPIIPNRFAGDSHSRREYAPERMRLDWHAGNIAAARSADRCDASHEAVEPREGPPRVHERGNPRGTRPTNAVLNLSFWQGVSLPRSHADPPFTRRSTTHNRAG